ncbi:MAG: tetratricopeptide repeat protein [Oscillospiraceae bacterium]
MKRFFYILLAALLLLTLAMCESPEPPNRRTDPGWQAKYDLGVRYLSEGNYQEAIIAFTAAIEIDPKQPKIYDRLATAYELAGDDEAALRTLLDGAAATGDRAGSSRRGKAQRTGLSLLRQDGSLYRRPEGGRHGRGCG